jgi:hypothetical protein
MKKIGGLHTVMSTRHTKFASVLGKMLAAPTLLKEGDVILA